MSVTKKDVGIMTDVTKPIALCSIYYTSLCFVLVVVVVCWVFVCFGFVFIVFIFVFIVGLLFLLSFDQGKYANL